MLTEALLFLLVLLLAYKWTRTAPSRLPPGPRAYPIIGTGEMTAQKVKKWQEKYGDIFTTRFGSITHVIICNYKLIKETFLKTETAGRPNWSAMNFLSDGEEAGVIFSNGERWQSSRRFLLRELRDFGMGKSSLDGAILKEAEALVGEFQKLVGKPSPLPDSISLVTLNVIWQLVASRRYDLQDEEILNFLKLVRIFQENIGLLLLPDIFPWLNWLPESLLKKLTKRDWLEQSSNRAREMMQEVIEEHRRNLDPNNPRDVIDSYLVEMEKQKDDPQIIFNEIDLLKNIFDLFSAGFDTTSNMVRHTFLYMAAFPKVQERVQAQIDDVVPRDQLPGTEHRSRLTYFDATLQEVHRHASMIEFGVVHAATEDLELEGYLIPKGTLISGSTVSCHMDPRYWDSPEEFRPERFLDEKGKFVAQRPGFLPFSVGRRSCLGEALARMELFLFTAAVLQKFTLAPVEGCQVDLSGKMVPGMKTPILQDLMITVRI